MSKGNKGRPIILRLDSLSTTAQHNWLRLAGVVTPRFQEHAELLIEEIQETWETRPATPLQERFLRLRGHWREELTQRQAYFLVSTIADHERSQELEDGKQPAWERLAELEPRLQDLRREASWRAAARSPFCRFEAWYGRAGLKVRLSRLVGLGAEQPGLLNSVAAYQVVYETLFAALPECDEDCPCQRE
jgi:hypothetical protein